MMIFIDSEPAGAAWTPAELAPHAWYNDDSSMSITSGLADNWGDLSGNGIDLTAGTTFRPTVVDPGLNGLRNLTFDGTSDRFLMPSQTAIAQDVSAMWCFCVYKKNSLDGAAQTRVTLWVSSSTTTSSRFVCASGATVANAPHMFVRRLDADSLATLTGTAFADTTTWHMVLWLMDYSTGDAYIYVDGEIDASNLALTSSGNTSNTASASVVNVGENSATINQNINDSMAELIVHRNNVPSGGDIDKLFGYAAHKWGLTANLDAGHPYKSTPPTV